MPNISKLTSVITSGISLNINLEAAWRRNNHLSPYFSYTLHWQRVTFLSCNLILILLTDRVGKLSHGVWCGSRKKIKNIQWCKVKHPLEVLILNESDPTKGSLRELCLFTLNPNSPYLILTRNNKHDWIFFSRLWEEHFQCSPESIDEMSDWF